MSVNCYLHYVFRADHLVLDNQLCALPGVTILGMS